MRDTDSYLYCWCGHLRTGHTRSLAVQSEGATQLCSGEDLLQKDPKPCDCPKFVPVEVATFRMLDQMSKHLVDFKIGFMVQSQKLLEHSGAEVDLTKGITH